MSSQLNLLNISSTAILKGTKPNFTVNYPINKEVKTFSSSQCKSLESALKTIFPSQKDESRLIKARRILGEIALDIPDEELERNLTEFQFLLDSWLDSFEKQVFNGKTLDQLLKEG